MSTRPVNASRFWLPLFAGRLEYVGSPSLTTKIPPMGRRLLVLPLSLLVSVLVLLAALTAAGGIPISVAIPLISGVVAALLTGGLALTGIWMNVRYQIERDRIERLRQAYVQILRAGDAILEAVKEVSAYPRGRPFPEPPGVVVSGSVFGPPSQLDIERARHDPWQVEDALIRRALDLAADAEATIYLEVGSENTVLETWRYLQIAHDKWREAVSDSDQSSEQDALRKKVSVVFELLRENAHRALKQLGGSR